MQRPRAPSRYLPEIQDAQSEDVRLTRAAAWDAYYRLRLVAPSPGVEEQAREVINAIKGLRASDSLEALDDAGESVRHRIDALIDDGDIVLLRYQETAENGQMVAARLRDENSVTLKRFYKEGNRVRLQPANITMDPIYTEASNVRIEGRVVGVMRQMY